MLLTFLNLKFHSFPHQPRPPPYHHPTPAYEEADKDSWGTSSPPPPLPLLPASGITNSTLFPLPLTSLGFLRIGTRFPTHLFGVLGVRGLFKARGDLGLFFGVDGVRGEGAEDLASRAWDVSFKFFGLRFGRGGGGGAARAGMWNRKSFGDLGEHFACLDGEGGEEGVVMPVGEVMLVRFCACAVSE
ncbi:hypothetical protein HYALB_00011262 [Hymenoscyphus albidus]|uniref:Uncharacterized protein n=1 Tax=Hymenoscyphus albidus TaxID=595503 RepID=A0A9N9LWD5_9HELO|nr:hypothetical protein HYALB_00011262 [Hymenoscyphus albidus]